ncbi:MAG TPA: hypothetical protein VGC63_03945 [Solirubrobacterales bacterium]|jgi:hypothetical protein
MRGKLTYSNVVSTLCLFLLLSGGVAFAASQLGKNTVGARQLKRNAVTSPKIKDAAVTSAKLRDGAVTGEKIDVATLGKVPSASKADDTIHAASADNASRATTAARATEASLLGGHDAAAFGSGVMSGQITGLTTGPEDGAPTGLSKAGVFTTVAGLLPPGVFQIADLNVSLRGGETMGMGTSRTISVVAGFDVTVSCTIHEGENGCTDLRSFSTPEEPHTTLTIRSNTTGAPGAQSVLFAYRIAPAR